MSFQKFLNEQTASYMRLRLHHPEGKVLELKVPTFWDATVSQWHGILQTKQGQMIRASGKDSEELLNNFNSLLKNILESHSDLSDEIFNMFEVIL